jgi:hypothetical protein
MEKPARWLVDASRDPRRFWPSGGPPSDVIDGGPEALAAWSIGAFCTETLRRIDDRCMVIDYEDLCTGMIAFAAERCGLSLRADYECRITEAFKVDSKRPAVDYVDDRERKNKSASASLRSCSERWVLEAYLQLRSRRARISL